MPNNPPKPYQYISKTPNQKKILQASKKIDFTYYIETEVFGCHKRIKNEPEYTVSEHRSTCTSLHI